MFNFFYVESPLQLLSAKSASNKFNQHKSILIVNISHGDREQNDKQILDLIGTEWSEVFIQKTQIGKVRILKKLLKNIIYFGFKYRGNVNKFFFGEYRNIEMALLNKVLSPKESVLLDDGSFTITAQKFYIQNRVIPYPNSVMYKAFGFLIKNLKTPNLYSFFKLDLFLLEGQVNYFDVPIKKKININKGQVFFFGSKFSEDKIMDLSDEINILSKVFDSFPEKVVCYVPHRDESLTKLNKISEIGYELKNLEKPAEVYFDETDIMPEVVLSYYSTVLYTCYLKFSNVNIQSIDIYYFLSQENARINAKEIYSYYKNLEINVLKI